MLKVLCVTSDPNAAAQLPLKTDQSVEISYVNNCESAVQLVQQQHFDGVYYADKCAGDAKSHSLSAVDLIQSSEMLDTIPEGLALLDGENKIIKANQRLAKWFPDTQLVGLNFYTAMGNPEIIGPVATPIATARLQGKNCTSTFKIGPFYFEASCVPIVPESGPCERMLVTVSDATESILRHEKIEALHQAGTALADLRPEEIYQMNMDERIDLLKDNIVHYTKSLLDFDVIDVRVLDRQTGRLDPLLSEGIDAEASQLPFYAKAEGNGVTGFVVATGESYLCEDTTLDPLYRDGLMGAKSSLTVPLIYHDEVVGSFNVESPEINAFTNQDLKFLECFARDIAVSLNTLELLNAQRTDAAMQSVTAIHNAVAVPLNEILNDAVYAIESYIGHDPEVNKRLRSILTQARKIKKVIHRVGEEMAPIDAVPLCIKADVRPALRDSCVLVIDADEQVRLSADSLLGKHGCDVETAHEGEEALMMVRNCDYPNGYDAIIADIRLPDIGGYELLMRLKEIVPDPPLILMTGFGYDPGHSIVKARQAGLKKNALLFKPFRSEQLFDVVEAMVLGEEPKTHEMPSAG